MIRLLTKNALGSPEQEFVNAEPVALMEKIETSIIHRVTEINKQKQQPQNEIKKFEED